MSENPNPRYWRSPSAHYIVNFEKVALISLAVQISSHVDSGPTLSGIVKVCIAFDRTNTPFLIYTPQEEFEQLMCAYERWLSER